MSPLQIEILLHYHCKEGEYTNIGKSPAHDLAVANFVRDGYLKKGDNVGDPFLYKSTDKLHAYCNALCSVPEPTQKWVVEYDNEQNT